MMADCPFELIRFLCRGLLFAHQFIALRFKFVSGLPFWEFISVRHVVADPEEQLHILDRAQKVPVWFYFVRNLVIIVQIEFVAPERRIRIAREQMLVLATVKGWHTVF